MEENIFKGAKFGDKFLTRDGRVAILQQIGLCNTNETEDGSVQDLPLYPVLFTDDDEINCGLDGCVYEQFEGHYKKSEDDIVSRYQESIDEEKLDELAVSAMAEYENTIIERFGLFGRPSDASLDTYYRGFKAGYRKVMEE